MSLSITVACGGSSKRSTAPGGEASASAGDGEVVAPVFYKMTLDSEFAAPLLMPSALNNLEWPAPPSDRSAAMQRRRFAAAGPNARQREATALATALWYAAPSGSMEEGTARAEARTVLRDVTAAGGASETALAMLTVAERALGDPAASAKVYDELILRFPQSPRAWRYRAVRAWLELRADRTTRAAEIINGADLAAVTTPSAIYYVAGWIALREGDATRAHALLVTALQRWGDLWSWDTVRAEAFQLAALAGATPTYMRQVIAEITNGPPKREAGTTNKRIRTVVRAGRRTTTVEETTIKYSRAWLELEMGRAYVVWGSSAAAEEMLGYALGDDPATDAAVERELLWLALAANQPEVALQHATAARAALAKATAESAASEVSELETAITADLAQLTTALGAFADVTQSPAHRAAAMGFADLSGQAVPAPVTLSQAGYQRAVLETQLGWSSGRLRACYARPLQTSPSFDGAVSFDLAASAGTPTLTNLTPEPGATGLGLVAACVAPIIATWQMPPAVGAAETSAHYDLRFKRMP